MKSQGDTKRPHSVKAEFDNDFNATANGGAVLAEKTLRSFRLRRMTNQYLPARSPMAKFSTKDAVHALKTITKPRCAISVCTIRPRVGSA